MIGRSRFFFDGMPVHLYEGHRVVLSVNDGSIKTTVGCTRHVPPSPLQATVTLSVDQSRVVIPV
jgi:hypothetical protein